MASIWLQYGFDMAFKRVKGEYYLEIISCLGFSFRNVLKYFRFKLIAGGWNPV
jgi:hypothetical protein